MKTKKKVNKTKRHIAQMKAKQTTSEHRFIVDNEFWKCRSKHGRDTIFTDPAKLAEEAHDYFSWCVANPYYKAEAKVVDGCVVFVDIPIKRPFGIIDFCLYIGVNSDYWRQFKRSKTYDNNPDFSTVMEYIEDTVRSQQLNGALSGFFNSNLVARVLGLRDASVVEVSDNRKAVADLFPLDIEHTVVEPKTLKPKKK